MERVLLASRDSWDPFLGGRLMGGESTYRVRFRVRVWVRARVIGRPLGRWRVRLS